MKYLFTADYKLISESYNGFLPRDFYLVNSETEDSEIKVVNKENSKTLYHTSIDIAMEIFTGKCKYWTPKSRVEYAKKVIQSEMIKRAL